MITETCGRLTWHSATASFESLPGGVLRLRMFGPLTKGALRHFSAFLAPPGAAAPVARILDYSGAALAVSETDLAELIHEADPASPVALPSAFVAPHGSSELLRAHALRMALAGFHRRTFTEAGAAHQWLVTRAAQSWSAGHPRS